MDKITCTLDDEQDRFTAVFPSAYNDGTGIMKVQLSYNEDHPKNRSLTGSHFRYNATVTVDGQEVFSTDDLGTSKHLGFAADSRDAYLATLPAAITFASAYPGSGHGEVCNENPHAHEHETVFSLASMACEPLERGDKSVIRWRAPEWKPREADLQHIEMTHSFE